MERVTEAELESAGRYLSIPAKAADSKVRGITKNTVSPLARGTPSMVSANLEFLTIDSIEVVG